MTEKTGLEQPIKLPKTLEELDAFCDNQRGFLTNDMFLYKAKRILKDTPIVPVPIVWTKNRPDSQYGIMVNGDYALCLIHNVRSEPKEIVIARCGFVLTHTELVITHTPQGTDENLVNEVAPKGFYKRVMSSPKQKNFRTEMMLTLIELDRSMGLKRVIGTPNEQFRKLDESRLEVKFGEKRMDEQFEEIGFKLDKDIKRYVYNL